jgi:hypothetical protein
MAPPKKNTEPLTLRLPSEILTALDDLRRGIDDLPTRPEMIRRLLLTHHDLAKLIRPLANEK